MQSFSRLKLDYTKTGQGWLNTIITKKYIWHRIKTKLKMADKMSNSIKLKFQLMSWNGSQFFRSKILPKPASVHNHCFFIINLWYVIKYVLISLHPAAGPFLPFRCFMGFKACDSVFCRHNCLTEVSVFKSCHTLACPALRCELDNNRCSRGPGSFFGISANVLLKPQEV